jgi:hypothetical protein
MPISRAVRYGTRPMLNDVKVRVTVDIPREMREEILERADAAGVTLSEMIRRLLHESLTPPPFVD